MKSARKLALRREAMVDLVTDDLRYIHAGASPAPCYVTDLSCQRCPSIPFEGCPSFPLGDCTILQETDSVTCPTDVC